MKFIASDLKSRIGIISPYKSQVRTLKDQLFPKLRQLGFPLDTIEINTVDAYQGREKDIIIISCVRGSQERALGFLNDYRRMNVALTRAKFFLWVIGNSRTLKRNQNWGGFIDYAKSKEKCLVKLQSKE
jgi:senataxin